MVRIYVIIGTMSGISDLKYLAFWEEVEYMVRIYLFIGTISGISDLKYLAFLEEDRLDEVLAPSRL